MSNKGVKYIGFDGVITGDHPVLENPSNVIELADFLEDTYKPYFKSTQVTPLYLDKDAGDDDNDGQSAITAVASIAKVVQLIHDVYSATSVVVNVALATTAYAVPFGFTRLNNVKFVGAQTVADTRSVVGTATASNDSGVNFIVDGATLTDDEWAGRILSLTNALNNTRNIIVVRNVGNTIYGAMHNRNFLSDVQSPASGGDVNVLDLPEFEFPSATVITGCIDLISEYIKITGGSIFCNGASKPQWIRCEIACTQIVAGNSGSSPHIFSSSIAMKGNSTNGILGARQAGQLRLGYGNVYIDTNITDPNYMKIKVAEQSAILWEGGGIFRGLAFFGLFFDGASSYPVSASALSLVFENDTGTASCTSAFLFNSGNTVSGAYYGVPECHGEITGDHYIQAANDARVQTSINSSVTTALGINYVSANASGGDSAMGPDGTVIRGAFPDSSTDWVQLLTRTATPTTLNLSETGSLRYDTTAGDKIAILPAIADNTTGTRITIINVGSSANQVTVNPDGSETIAGASSLVLTDGQSVTLQSYGTDWEIVAHTAPRVAVTRVTTSPYTVLSQDNNIFIDTDGGAITVNLPVGIPGASYRIINCGSSGNDMTIVPDGSELLLGANSNKTASDRTVIILTYEATEGWW